ncbi:MAG: hypothetical protein K6G10_11045 [Butyrivibrio sp.]|nr:hypothetical protein [Butyrivibrio sp.]
MPEIKYIPIELKHVEVFFVSVLLLVLSVVNFNYRYYPRYARDAIVIALVLFAYCIAHFLILLDSKYIFFNIFLLVFGGEMLYSNIINRRIQGDFVITYKDIFTQVLRYILPFFLMEIMKEKNYLKDTMMMLWAETLGLCLITDAHAILKGAKHIGGIGSYLVGNKFNLSYTHFFLLAFFMTVWDREKKRDRILMIVQVAVSFVITIYSECTTALVAMLLFFVVYFFRKLFMEKCANPISALLVMLISNVVLLVFPTVTQWGPIKNFIENVLHEDVTLTGRLRGIGRILAAISVSPVWGVGYHNNYAVSKLITRMDDLQNGLADVILSFGIVGGILFIILTFICLNAAYDEASTGFLMLAYLFILISSVEITLNLKFVVVLAFLFACTERKRDPLVEVHI